MDLLARFRETLRAKGQGLPSLCSPRLFKEWIGVITSFELLTVKTHNHEGITCPCYPTPCEHCLDGLAVVQAGAFSCFLKPLEESPQTFRHLLLAASAQTCDVLHGSDRCTDNLRGLAVLWTQGRLYALPSEPNPPESRPLPDPIDAFGVLYRIYGPLACYESHIPCEDSDSLIPAYLGQGEGEVNHDA